MCIASVVASDRSSWWTLGALVVINVSALSLALSTKPSSPDAPPAARMFTRMARNTGFIVGIGGWVPAILLLHDLLRAE
jgi:hypothetical protein